jgi:hypothetical protein
VRRWVYSLIAEGYADLVSGLPQPKVSYLDKLRTQAAQRAAGPPLVPSPEQTSSRPARAARQDSLDPSSDPWASPANTRGPPPYTAAHSTPSNGFPGSSTQPTLNGVTSTSPTFNTRGSQPAESGAVSQMLQQLVAVALVKLVGINQEDRIMIRKGPSVLTLGLCQVAVLAKPLQSPCCQKRKACSCFSITTMK